MAAEALFSLFARTMATFLATLQVAALGSAPSHILSDTPSYLRTRGALHTTDGPRTPES